MTADTQDRGPATWMDKNTGIIYTWDIETGKWVNSSALAGKPRLLAIDSITAEDITAGSVGTDALADASVTVPKLAADVLALIAAATIPRREVLMATGVTDPPDPLVSSDGADWLYGEVT